MLESILDKYDFSSDEKEDFKRLTYTIFSNRYFQQRMEKNFPHHNDISLGYHILSDAAVTYKICQMNICKYIGINVEVAVTIAMMHDLYTMPWQNNPDNVQDNYCNEHGFRHPLEAVINSISWFPEYFTDEKKSEVIIDGIVHHMFPYPVRRIDKTSLELKNSDLFESLPTNLKQILVESSNRGIHIRHLSVSPSKFLEGRIMSIADKKVAFFDDTIYTLKINKSKSIYSFIALINGQNKNLSNYHKK